MKKLNTVIWGVILVAVGLILALNALEITNINIFFNGWWTLFIIIPCAVGLFTGHDKTGPLIGLLVGVFLLLNAQDVISFRMLWKLIFPAIIIIIGCNLLWKAFVGSRNYEEINKKIKENSGKFKYGTATFSGQNMNFDGEVFEGAELNAIFGAVKCDLRFARIENDAVINASAIFGGIDIYVPDNINVKVISNSIFGGVSNKKTARHENVPTLYINATCMFGGVDVK